MTKTRIGERLSQAGQDNTKTNRSAELASFNERFDSFDKSLFKPLAEAMKKHLKNMQQAEKSQTEVSQNLLLFVLVTHGTVLHIRNAEVPFAVRSPLTASSAVRPPPL